MPGYSKLVIDGVSPKYLCTHCQLILRNPKQSLCGHRFCYSCIDHLISQTGRYDCPICSTEDPTSEDSILSVDTINPDYAIKREMRKLSAKCVNDGCHWTGIFAKFVEHEEVCEYGLIICFKQGCSEKIRRRDLDTHLENDCRLRLTMCRHCDMKIIYTDMENHLHTECQGVPVTCKFCNENIPRRELQQHSDQRSGTCRRTREACKFQAIGCEDLIDRDKQSEHDANAIQDHTQLLLNKVVDIKMSMDSYQRNGRTIEEMTSRVREQATNAESLQERVAALENEIKSAQSRMQNTPSVDSQKVRAIVNKNEEVVKSLKTKTTVLETKIVTYEGIVAVLNQQVERNAEMVQKERKEAKKNQDLLEMLQKKVKAQDRIIAQKDISLAEHDLRIQSLEMTSYNGVLDWKIPDFARKRQDAISGRTLSIYSPQFYTSRFGYKMCVRVYLNGDGMGKGNHVSLFFTIMKGEYDALLRWPFRQKVTFMWIDQNNREHLVDAFRPDPTSNSFRRPTSDMNIASGCPLFMPLSTLENGRQVYVKDDIAFLRITVDTSDLNF